MSVTTTPTLYNGVYPAIVYSIADPNKVGRIQMYIPQIFQNQPVLIWAPPLFSGGAVPATGDVVWCLFQGGDTSYPTYLPPLPPPYVPPAPLSGQIVQQQSYSQVGGTASLNNTAYSSIYPAVTLTKRFAGTKLRVDIRLSAYLTGTGTALLQIAAQVAGVDTLVAQYFFNALADHRAFSGSNDILNVAAGSVSVQGRIRLSVSTVAWNIDPNDWWTMDVTEVW